MAASEVIAKDKNTFSASIKVTIIVSVVVILMSFLASSYSEGLCKKAAFENLTEKNVCAGSFFNKYSGRGSAILLQTLQY